MLLTIGGTFLYNEVTLRNKAGISHHANLLSLKPFSPALGKPIKELMLTTYYMQVPMPNCWKCEKPLRLLRGEAHCPHCEVSLGLAACDKCGEWFDAENEGVYTLSSQRDDGDSLCPKHCTSFQNYSYSYSEH